MSRSSFRGWVRAVSCFLLSGLAADWASAAEQPSFDCRTVRAQSAADLVCRDDALARLDRTLATVYAQATKKAVDQHRPTLEADQRGWLDGRDECSKDGDPRACVERSYRRRIAALQARYRLVPAIGPVAYACDGDPANEVIATYFQTDPPVLIAERGDSVAVMYIDRSGSGARYVGPNESLWEHQGEATVHWGGKPELHCVRKP